MFLELGCDLSDVDRREGPVGSKFGPTTRHPVVDTEPSKRGDVIIKKAGESIIHSKGCVALVEAVPDGSAGCSVHSSCGGTKTGRKSENSNTHI